MKINQNVKFWTSYNTKIFKICTGFSSKLKPHNSLNLALCRACLYEHFCSSQLYLKKAPRESKYWPFWPPLRSHFVRFALCFPCFGAQRFGAQFRLLETLRLIPWLLLWNPSGNQNSTSSRHFSCFSPCGERNWVSASKRPPSGQKQVFSELPKLHKYKWKSIKLSSFGHLIRPKYSKSAKVSH